MNLFLPDQGPARLVAIAAWGAVGIGFSTLSLTSTLASISAKSAPDFALRMDSSNADAWTAKGELQLMSASQGQGKLSDVSLTARAAIAARALSPASLRQLAFAAPENVTPASKARLIRLSSRLSRRDFGVQVWNIEDAVDRNDIPGALKAYDVALRTNRDSPTVLFPTLAAALENPEVGNHFRPYLKAAPPWLAAFMDNIVGNETHAAALAKIGVAVGGLPTGRDNADLHDRIIDVLLRQRNVAAVKSYYTSRATHLGLLTSTDLNQASLANDSGPLGWQMFSEASYGADVAEGNVMRIFAAPGRSGIVARKLLFLRPGNYAISARFKVATFAPSSFLRLQLSCANAASPSPVWIGPDVASGNGYTARLVVPENCGAQNLEIVAGGGDSRGDTEIEVAAMRMSAAPAVR